METNPFVYLWFAMLAFLLALVGLVLALTAGDPGRRRLFWWATAGSAVGAVALVVIYVFTLFSAVRESFDYIEEDAPRYEAPDWHEENLEEGESQADSLKMMLDSLGATTL